jgi:hypothetical protein
MCTIGIDWRRLTKDRAVANFCTPAPFVPHILLSILGLWPKSRRTLWYFFCTPAPLPAKPTLQRLVKRQHLVLVDTPSAPPPAIISLTALGEPLIDSRGAHTGVNDSETLAKCTMAKDCKVLP